MSSNKVTKDNHRLPPQTLSIMLAVREWLLMMLSVKTSCQISFFLWSTEHPPVSYCVSFIILVAGRLATVSHSSPPGLCCYICHRTMLRASDTISVILDQWSVQRTDCILSTLWCAAEIYSNWNDAIAPNRKWDLLTVMWRYPVIQRKLNGHCFIFLHSLMKQGWQPGLDTGCWMDSEGLQWRLVTWLTTPCCIQMDLCEAWKRWLLETATAWSRHTRIIFYFYFQIYLIFVAWNFWILTDECVSDVQWDDKLARNRYIQRKNIWDHSWTFYTPFA